MSPDTPGAPIEEMTKKCPMCAERIRLEAIVCRYCGHRFDPEEVGREVRKVEEELARLPGAAPRWCLVVDQVPPERRMALLGILRELGPAQNAQETGATLDGRNVRIARGLSTEQANSLLARLFAVGVPARKMPENGATARSTPPAERPIGSVRSQRRRRRPGKMATGDGVLVAFIGTLMLVALLLGYVNLTRFHSRRVVQVLTPASTAGDPVDGRAKAQRAAAGADAPVPPPASSEEGDAADGPDHVFFFSRGDRLVSMSGDPVGTVERVERTYTFPDGKVGAAYVVRTPAKTVAPFHASRLERAARLQ